MKIIIQNQTARRIGLKRLKALGVFLKKKLARVHRHPPLQHFLSKEKQGADLSLVFLTKTKARQINRQFRHKDYATDVLSFKASEFGVGLGELVLCPQVIARNAAEHGLTVADELDYMVIHGVLHLLGYEHEKRPAQAREMLALQDRLWRQWLKSWAKRP